MEEAVAMETDDRMSKIPDHIIHCILGFLPSVKDVVRTSAVSKSWHQAWLTFPIPQFIKQWDFGYRDQFIGFVENTLKRFGRQNEDGMKNFNLSALNIMAPFITSWIGMALDNKVEHLALEILYVSLLPCLIPDGILSSYRLKSLKLVGPRICIQPLNENSHVNLPLLTSLRIQYSNHINDQQLQKLLSGCPALEEISLLECHSLSKVDIFYHPNLKNLEFTVSNKAIRVRAPKLKSFNYASLCVDGCDVVVKIHNSPELKSLSIRDKNKTDEWFHKFIAQFPLLEHLTIDYCFALRKIRISNPLLHKIKIKYCHNLENVVISTKKLTTLSLRTLYSSIPNPSFRMDMNNHLNDCMLNISNPNGWGGPHTHLIDPSWYCKLKEFLTRPTTFKSLKIIENDMHGEDGDMYGEDVQKKLPHEACNIEKLSLRVWTPSSCHPHILNGLLSTCHPTIIELYVNSGNSFGKFVCKEFGNRENNSRCYCKDDFKCWKHQLKEVKIMKINDIKGIKIKEHLDWDVLFGLLPTLKAGNTIYFKLMW